jgi:hypothetical protein
MASVLAEGSFLTDVAALLTAITGLIAGILAFWKYLDERRKRKEAEDQREEAEERGRELEREIESVSKDSAHLKTKAQKVREYVLTMESPMSAGEISKGAGVNPPVFWILKDLISEGILEKQGNPKRPLYRKKG